MSFVSRAVDRIPWTSTACQSRTVLVFSTCQYHQRAKTYTLTRAFLANDPKMAPARA